jgi:hypothetical protein
MPKFEEVDSLPRSNHNSKWRKLVQEFLDSGLKLVKLDPKLIGKNARVTATSIQGILRYDKLPVKIHYRAKGNSVFLERLET